MDSILLFPPGASTVGSAIQLGSWLAGDQTQDFGAKDLIHSIQAQNAMRDGGMFALRYAPVRHMAFPLIVNTASVPVWEGLLAQYSTPGAYIAVQPEGTPSAEAVYFDVIDGRWEPEYSIFENRAHVRKGVLHLDTQPWGYWPTEILLASSASVGRFGQLAINAPASLIGDVPPMAHILVKPTTASVYGGFGQWRADMVAYGLGGRPSFTPLIGASAFLPNFAQGASGGGDVFAPASYFISATQAVAGGGWFMLCDSGSFIPSALEPAYRGRFRVFAYAQAAPSYGTPWQMIVDADRLNTGMYPAMASSNQLASVYSVIPTAALTSSCYVGSPQYAMLDMGEVTLPPQASGFQQGVRLRVWVSPPSSASFMSIRFGGLFLLPVDGAGGILTRGLTLPTLGAGNAGTVGILEFNNQFVDSVLIQNPIGGSAIGYDWRSQFRGLTPRLGGSTNSITIVTGDRWVANNGFGATFPVAHGGFEYSQVSVSYRPQFQFLNGGI